ncbi:MAG: response regulator transcription factor [Caldilineaceae bacterium]
MIRIFIVEDHPIMRQSYALLIQDDPTMLVCGEAASGRAALEQIPNCNPDIVVIDISLSGDMSGIDLLKQLRSRYTELPILIVSGYEESMYAAWTRRLGAQGYVMKDQIEAFLPALQQIIKDAPNLKQ